MYEKLKSFLTDDTFFIAILLILVSLVSFGLGRKSVIREVVGVTPSTPAGVIFTDSSKYVENKAQITSTEDTKVVVSKTGTKYHLLSCPGASQIKESNKVYFDSIDLAKAAGYLPAANCMGI